MTQQSNQQQFTIDKLPEALEDWANRNEQLKGDPNITQLTREHAQQMRQYQQSGKGAEIVKELAKSVSGKG
jgi:hypothetical protein